MAEPTESNILLKESLQKSELVITFYMASFDAGTCPMTIPSNIPTTSSEISFPNIGIVDILNSIRQSHTKENTKKLRLEKGGKRSTGPKKVA